MDFRLKLYPADFKKVREFYKDVLGFGIAHEWDREESKGVMFDTGSGIIELLWPGEGSNYTKDNGINLSLEILDVKKQWEKYQNEDFIAYPLKHNSWGDTSFGLYDPEGFRITFFTKD